jgi:hypothetical protein
MVRSETKIQGYDSLFSFYTRYPSHPESTVDDGIQKTAQRNKAAFLFVIANPVRWLEEV